jgi:hypothetical protein
MRNVSRFATILFLCLAVAGCYETFPPIQSGNVTHWQGGRPQGSAQQLTPEQVANLSAWLQSHRWGWQPVIATYAPSIIINVVHSNGTKTSANLMQKILIVGQHQRSLSEAENQELHSIIGAQYGG